MIMFIIRENVFTVLAPTDEAFAGCFFQTIIYHSPYQLSWFQPPELLSQNWHNLTGRSWFRDEGKAFCGENCCWAGDQCVTSVTPVCDQCCDQCVTSVWPVCDQCVTSVVTSVWPVCDQCCDQCGCDIICDQIRWFELTFCQEPCAAPLCPRFSIMSRLLEN